MPPIDLTKMFSICSHVLQRAAAADHERHAAARQHAAAGGGVVGLDGVDDVVERQAVALQLARVEA